MTRFNRLSDWLDWQNTLHPDRIELGLDRVAKVAARIGLLQPDYRVISVAAGYRTATYTSPHLLRYNERIRIDGCEVTDRQLCDAFARVDSAREDVSLTYFEFGTLAALGLFEQARPDIAILEVGMGGRLVVKKPGYTDRAVRRSARILHHPTVCGRVHLIPVPTGARAAPDLIISPNPTAGPGTAGPCAARGCRCRHLPVRISWIMPPACWPSSRRCRLSCRSGATLSHAALRPYS